MVSRRTDRNLHGSRSTASYQQNQDQYNFPPPIHPPIPSQPNLSVGGSNSNPKPNLNPKHISHHSSTPDSNPTPTPTPNPHTNPTRNPILLQLL